MKVLTKSKSMEKENDIDLGHDDDGIKELDNDLPPWWVYLFYATVIFSVVYLGKYHLFGGDNQYKELENELAIAAQIGRASCRERCGSWWLWYRDGVN